MFAFAAATSPFTDHSTNPCVLPALAGVQVSARFHEPRIGGDFFDVVHGKNYFALMMTDIAGDRDTTERIAAEVQEIFRQHAVVALQPDYINEPETATELLRIINGAIMSAAGGVRCSPTFLAIYNISLNTVTYISAGAPAAVMLSDGEVRILESNGIPLGLFTHLTHDPLPLAVEAGARLVLVSKGVLERRQDGQEFGMQRVCKLLLDLQHSTAETITSTLLETVVAFGSHHGSGLRNGISRITHPFGSHDDEQDLTVLTLARN
jgi:hypothetical protein